MPERDLALRAAALTESVGELAGAVQRLTESQARIKKAIILTVVGLVLDLTLTVVVGLLYGNARANSNRIAEANHRIEEVQLRTSDQVLCPLYALFIAFEPRAKDNPQFTEQERAERRHAYEVIHQGYDTLGCHS